MDSSSKAQAQEAKEEEMKESLWNAFFFFTGVIAGAWALAIILAASGTFTDTQFILELKP